MHAFLRYHAIQRGDIVAEQRLDPRSLDLQHGVFFVAHR